jgi:pyridoxal phosphate enzyme (YggS family)
MTAGPDDERQRELAQGLAQVRQRIDDACARGGRDPSGVTLIVVTKTYPASDVQRLFDLGVRDVGENRPQEAAGKHADLAARLAPAEPVSAAMGQDALRWHLVGGLQTNKARSVAQWADVVHSLDRDRAVAALSRAATDAGRVVEGLVQVSLDDDPSPGRGGAPPAEVVGLADLVAESPGLHLRGVMAVAPLGMEPARAFGRLIEVADQVRAQHPEATWVSAGMSGDLEAAIGAGATHVRVGSAVLGDRPRLR